MAGRGPAPKPNALRRRDNAPVTVLTFTKAAQPYLPADRDWHPMTLDWWRTWGESAMAEHMTAVDWNVLRSTAVFVEKIWTRASTEAAKEVRLREESFGASIAARLRLRMQFADADDAGAPEVLTGSAERFRSLTVVPTAAGE